MKRSKHPARLKKFEFGAVNIVKYQIDAELADNSDAALIFAIIARAQTDALALYGAEEDLIGGRKFINVTDRGFVKYCDLLGINAEWAIKIFRKEIALYENYALYQHQLFFYFVPFILTAIRTDTSVFNLSYILRVLAKKVYLHYFTHATKNSVAEN